VLGGDRQALRPLPRWCRHGQFQRRRGPSARSTAPNRSSQLRSTADTVAAFPLLPPLPAHPTGGRDVRRPGHRNEREQLLVQQLGLLDRRR
jgi:hypothetical protein